MLYVIKALQQLYETAVADASSPLHDVKRVIFGDPQKIPESCLPAITIMPVSSDYTLRGSQYDQRDHTIEVRLVFNQRKFFDCDLTIAKDNKVFLVEDAIEKAERFTSASAQANSDNTLAGVIEKNICLPYTDGNGDTVIVSELAKVETINYTLEQRRAFPSFEIVLTMSAITVGNR